MPHIKRSALVPHTARQMFDLVNDVETYPQRFEWCEGAEVLERSEQSVVARLDLRLAGMRSAFTTRNDLDPGQRIRMSLVEGPFSALSGEWQFLALGEDGSKVTLILDFEMAGRFVGSALALGFQGLTDRMVDDFVREARLAYV